MPDQKFIDAQHAQLAVHRRTLAHLLHQAAQHGGVSFAPPQTVNGMAEARAEIARIKAAVRESGTAVDDEPDDQAPLVDPAQPAAPMTRSVTIQNTTSVGTMAADAEVAGVKITQPTVGVMNIYGSGTPTLEPPDVIAVAQARVAALPIERLPDPAPLPSGSRMPLNRNPLFVGREDDLLSLARALKSGSTAAIGQIAAATGLGGIGKTNLATEFVHRYGQFFAGGVFWLSFADAAGVSAEIALCGSPAAMNLPSFDTLKPEDQIARVRQEWQSAIPRLLVFDNCEDESLLATMRPTSGGCRILITSRRAQWNPILGVEALPLEVLPRAESVGLLRKFLPLFPLDDPGLDPVAAELGDLPLALHLAGSYLAKYQRVVTPASYLAQLRDPALLQHRSLQSSGLSPTGHVLDVGRTFALSYDRLDAHDSIDALAITLLARAACFAPGEPILRDLLTAKLESADEDAALQLEDSLTRLVDLGLIDVEANRMLRLHRLLSAFARTLPVITVTQDDIEQVLLEIANRLNIAGYPAALLVIQRHLRAATDRARLRTDKHVADLCYTLGYCLKMLAEYTDARPYLEQALAIYRVVSGEHHPDTARSLNLLGQLLKDQGDLAGGRLYLEQALAIWREVLGEHHPNTAASLNNLGALLKAQGNPAEARLYFEQALAIRRAVLGEHHPDTAVSLNNLGYLLQDQGDLVDARPYLEQALAISRKVLGEHHPNTASGLNNISVLLQDQGDLAGARSSCEQALAIRRTVCGEHHPDTAMSLSNLGVLLYKQGDLTAARTYLEQALAIRRAVYGEHHPDTAMSLSNLGYLLQHQGDPAGARLYFEQALAIRRDVLGERHPDMAASLSNLGSLLRAQGDLAGARLYLEQALAIYEYAIGSDHADTRVVRANLAALDSLP